MVWVRVRVWMWVRVRRGCMRGRALRVRVRKRATESNRHLCEGGGEGGMRRSKGEIETYSQERVES